MPPRPRASTLPLLAALALLPALSVTGCGDPAPAGVAPGGAPGGATGAGAAAPAPSYPSTGPHQGGVELDGGLVTRSIGAACVDCHEDVVNAYASSGMHHSLTLPSGAGSVEARMAGREVVDRETGITGRLDARDDGYVVRMLYRDPAGVERAHYDSRIDLVVGSGHATRSYFQSKDGFLFELPLTWYRQLDDLALSPGPGFKQLVLREADHLCVSCHTGSIEPRDPALATGYRGEITLGIGCVRCHGDGTQHCDTGDPADIANPARMSEERQAEVCNQCHYSGALDLLKAGRSLADYTPGEPLGRVYGIFEPAGGSQDAGTSIAGHGKRMRKSRCFTESEGMTCTTCHNPHRGHKRADTAVDTRGGCFVCHGDEDCHEDAATRGEEACATCHMARQPSNDIQHTTTTDHFIRVRPRLPEGRQITPEERSVGALALRDAELVNVLDPEDEFPGAALLKARAYMNGVELAARLFGRAAPHYIERAQRHVERALDETPHDQGAEALRALLLSMQGNDLSALTMAERMLARDPGSIAGIQRKAFALLGLRRYAEAAEWLGRARQDNPYQALLAVRQADAYEAIGEAAPALDALDDLRERIGPAPDRSLQAVSIAWRSGLFARGVAHAYDRLIFLPRDPAALADAGNMCREAGRPDAQCRPLFQEALRHAPKSQEALVGLARLELREGRTGEGRKLLRRAQRTPEVEDLLRGLR